MAEEECHKLQWTSQNERRMFNAGEYATISEASDDNSAAKAHLHAQHPASVDFHYPHDIEDGTSRTVPITRIPEQRE